MDEVLRQIFDWKRVSSGTIYGRFFKKFTTSMNHEIFIEMYNYFLNQLHFDNDTIEVDGSTVTRYGQEEGSLRGYVPEISYL